MSQNTSPSNDIDLTPMLDVVFILLIFFVVTASFIKESALPFSSESEEKKSSSDSSAVVITLTSSNDVLFDGRKVDVLALYALIAQKKAADKITSAIVNAHLEALTENYVTILDAARRANVYDVAITTFE